MMGRKEMPNELDQMAYQGFRHSMVGLGIDQRNNGLALKQVE